MLPYFIFLLLSLFFCWLAVRKQKVHYWGIFVLLALMTLFAGLRSAEVGTDSGAYARSFESERYELREFPSGIEALTEEPGFYYLNVWLGSISSEYSILFIGIAFIFTSLFLISIFKQSEYPLLSLFVFITMGYYTFVFNAARQGLALAIYMLAIPSIINKQFWKYTIIVLIAALFHKTIIIAIPLYFFFTMRFSSRSMLIALLGGVIIGYMLPAILDYSATLEDRYELYTTGSATGGYLLTVFYVVLATFFIIQRRRINNESLKRYDIYLHMLIIGSAIYLIVLLTRSYVEITRFAAYFQVASIFLWPILLRESKVRIDPFFASFVILGHLGYFAIYLSKMANLTPYLFNPSFFG